MPDLTARSPSFGGQSAPPSLKVEQPFRYLAVVRSFGGQSAPPSLKDFGLPFFEFANILFRGAVRPPFIEGTADSSVFARCPQVSGGSPPPLH